MTDALELEPARAGQPNSALLPAKGAEVRQRCCCLGVGATSKIRRALSRRGDDDAAGEPGTAWTSPCRPARWSARRSSARLPPSTRLAIGWPWSSTSRKEKSPGAGYGRKSAAQTPSCAPSIVVGREVLLPVMPMIEEVAGACPPEQPDWCRTPAWHADRSPGRRGNTFRGRSGGVSRR